MALVYLCCHLKLYYLAQVLKFVTAWLCLNSGHTHLALSHCSAPALPVPHDCRQLELATDHALASAAADSEGANLGPFVLKVPFSVGRAEVMAPLLCGESRASPLSAAAVKHGQMLSHWCALYVVGGKKKTVCKKKAFFSSVSYFAEQGKTHAAPPQGSWLSLWEGSSYSSVLAARGAHQQPGEPD